MPSYLGLLRAGFAWPTGHPAAGGLLPHLFTLTWRCLSGDRRRRRCNFCGTFLRVAPTGCYPAPCSLEPGLSSNRLLGRRSPVRLGPMRILRVGCGLLNLGVQRQVGELIRAPVAVPLHVINGNVWELLQELDRLAVEAFQMEI